MLLNLESLGWLMVREFNGLAWTMQPPPGTPNHRRGRAGAVLATDTRNLIKHYMTN
jgi:hypothetical protein